MNSEIQKRITAAAVNSASVHARNEEVRGLVLEAIQVAKGEPLDENLLRIADRIQMEIIALFYETVDEANERRIEKREAHKKELIERGFLARDL